MSQNEEMNANSVKNEADGTGPKDKEEIKAVSPEEAVNGKKAEAEPLDQEAAAENKKSDRTEEVQEKIEETVDEWKNKAAYLAAEVENMRKRFVKEKSDVIKMANEELLKGMLPVFDNLLLGIKAVKDAEEKDGVKESPVFKNLFKGVEMTLLHFEQTLERVGVTPIESVGKPFDPAHAEAVGQSKDEDFEDNIVTQEFQRGFKLHGRVIRPAKVIVNKK